MKRIIISAMTALAAVSCVIDDGDGNERRTGQNLLAYSETVFSDLVIAPTEYLNYLLVLDEFLQLTEDEKGSPEWATFKSELEIIKETCVRVPEKGFIVNTAGKSIRTPGNSWSIIRYGNFIQSWESGNYYNWVGPDSDRSDGERMLLLTCTAADRYEITDEKGGREFMQLSYEAIPSPEGGYDFSCSGSGKTEETPKGMSSRFELSDFYYQRYRITADGTGHSSVTISYSTEVVEFRLDTYHHGRALDWCEFKKTRDGIMEIGSNLGYRVSDLFYE